MFGQNENFFFFVVFWGCSEEKAVQSKVQSSAEIGHRPNYVRYSDLLVQKLNAVLQFSVYVPGAMHGYKTCVLRAPSRTRAVSTLVGLALSSSCRAETLLDSCNRVEQ